MKTIDIIIPIYNAFDDLVLCLESIYKHTDLTINRLILINDNSTDKQIEPYLKKQQSSNIIVINNKMNKGFSSNINIGLKISDENDVILLNSDTVVTSRWVEKMTACAYRNNFIGTVTPLSNNATLCSVPSFCKENQLPSDMSIDEAGEIIEKCSLKKYPRISVAHGFCMFIKREVIKKVGLFDADTFGRGYGEENDFCNRAAQLGYYHVMCDDTYIFHSGTKSFISKEKERYIKEHDRILRERYPEQMQQNDVHVITNPNHEVGENAANYFNLFNHKKNVLLLGYSDFRRNAEDNVGGTQLHVKHLAMQLSEDFNIFVAARNYSSLQVTAYIGENEYVYRFSIGSQLSFFPASDETLAEVIRNVLVAFRINLVHVHHTKKTSLDIYNEAAKLGIPVITTIHDYYFICPALNMLDSDNEICIDKETPDCALCLDEKCGIYRELNFLPSWRELHLRALNTCSLLITPSHSARNVFLKYYPELNNKLITIEHGMNKTSFSSVMKMHDYIETGDLILDVRISYSRTSSMVSVEGTIKSCCGLNSFDQAALRLTDKNNQDNYLPLYLDQNNYFTAYIPDFYIRTTALTLTPVVLRDGKYLGNVKSCFIVEKEEAESPYKLRVAFIGGLNEIKGGEIAADLIADNNMDIEWFTFGMIGEPKLADLHKKNYFAMGQYQQENLQDLLHFYQIDIICILSIWPETFSYTLSEAILSKIPVIVTNTGALAERVGKLKIGEIVELESAAAETRSILNAWAHCPDKYRHYKDAVNAVQHISIEEMSTQYAKIYAQTAVTSSESLFPFSFNSKSVFEASHGSINRSDGYYPSILQEVSRLQRELDSIKNTYTYKIVSKLTAMNFPFKHRIYAWLQKKST